MCDNERTADHRRYTWGRQVGLDGSGEVPEALTGHRAHHRKWRVGGWAGGIYGKLKEAGMDGKGTLKMFHRKKRELIKTPSISKKSRAGSPGTQSGVPSLSILQEQPRRDVVDFSPSSSTSTLTPTSAGLLDPSMSCPSTPNPHHSKLAGLQVVGCPSPVATLKRPTALSRHASAAGFPLQSWVFTKGQGKGASAPTAPNDGPESTAIEVEDIPALLRDVARFAEAVDKLKDVVLAEAPLTYLEPGKEESLRPVAHECLGEVLRVLRQVISTYPLLNTVEILTAAGMLISKVKGFHYEACNEADKKDFEKAIETIAVAFSSNVSELLMGEVDSSTLLNLLPTEKSRSMENLHAASGQGYDGSQFRNDPQYIGRVEEVDIILQHSERGVEEALLYAKTISKYMKDLIGYVEKRLSLEMEFSKNLQRLYQSCKHSITQPHMPFFSIYSLALEQDQEQSVGLQQAHARLHNQTFILPLLQRKQEHEKRRKEIKEQWIRARRKLMECEANLRKAKQAYMARCEEYEKAKAAACRAEEDGGGSTGKSLEKKKRLEEETRNKADEAEATYRTCIADATTQQLDLEHTKVTVLRQLQEVIKQSDQTLRSATISYYQNMHMQTVALPVHYQTLCESSKLYDPGQQYAAHVRDLHLPEQPTRHYAFEPYSPTSSSSQQGHRTRIDSFNMDQPSGMDSCSVDTGPGDGRETERNRKRLGHKSWGSTVSDDSVGGMESPTASTCDINKIARTSSTGTISSEDEKPDGNVASFETPNGNGMEPDVVSTGPFRNIGLSRAAQTHRLRKLRTPSKCRECDSYVYFQGAECEECFLACHKRCLEMLAIQCGHKKLQGRLQLFGREFSQAASCGSDGIPFIITKCVSEIERRALKMKGIYRVNGVKTRVEKLCQSFENGKELVELSPCSPHDISNCLKLYLRQLPEPIMPFPLYNNLMGLAKESLQADTPGEDAESGSGSHVMGRGPELVDLGPDTDPDALVLVDKLRELLKGLPKPNIATLRYIIRHLRRISELEQENKMSPSNLGIVFGPSLMRPRPTGATVSLSSLVDYPHQARIIEALIVFYTAIFQSKTSSCSTTRHTPSTQQGGSTVEAEDSGGTEEQNRQDHDKMEEGCDSSLGSSEQLDRDSDSELDESGQATTHSQQPHTLVKQDSVVSTDDDQLNRDSLDLSSQPMCHTDADQESQKAFDGGGPPVLPQCEPPEEIGAEEDLGATLSQLNINQSNNNCSSTVSIAGHTPTRLHGQKLPLTRNADRDAEFV